MWSMRASRAGARKCAMYIHGSTVSGRGSSQFTSTSARSNGNTSTMSGASVGDELPAHAVLTVGAAGPGSGLLATVGRRIRNAESNFIIEALDPTQLAASRTVLITVSA